MSESPPPQRFGRVAAIIPVTDLDAALAFYTGVLGFEKTFQNGDPVGFVILHRDDAELHLSRAPNHRSTTQNVAHLLVDDARELYERLTAAGTRIVKGIRDADYGLRCFVFADPDGNRIDVGQVLEAGHSVE